MKVTEKSIHWGIVNALRMLGAAVYSTAQSRPSKVSVGIPDLMVFSRGKFAFVEVKKPGGKVTTHQKVFRDECLEAGIACECWSSVEQAVRWVTENRRRVA